MKEVVSKSFVVVPLILLLACGNNLEEKVECYEQNTMLMAKASVFRMQEAYIRGKIASSEDSAFVNDVLSISSLLEIASDELIVASGGIEENSSHLLNDCVNSEKAASIVGEKKLAVKKRLNLLYTRYDRQKYQASITKINEAAEQFFYENKSSLRKQRKLDEVPVSLFINDMVAMQSFINSVLLVDYL